MCQTKNYPAGIKERIFFNQDFKLDWRDPDEATDGYQLKWIGKDYARLQTGTAPATVIIPNSKHNTENKNSENIFLTGDNLEVLKHLQNSYRNSIKMIYIDPPYNTGNDGFVYNDKFVFSDEQLKDMLGMTDDEIKRLHTINGRSSHSAWLTFIYPRLRLARNLLTDDGVIFISIDDNEQANLKLLCDEIFGEGNFEANIMPIVNPGGRDYKQVAITHEYLLVYSKSELSEINEIPKDTEFKFSDSKGGFNLRELRNRNPKFHSINRPNLFYTFYVNPQIKNDDGYCAVSLSKNDNYNIEVKPYNSEGKESVWRWGKEKALKNLMLDDLNKSQIMAKQKNDGNWNIYEKNRKDTTKVKSLWNDTEMRTENGTREIRNLFNSTPFDHPKSIGLIKRCVEMGTEEDSLILDFFAGSGTTAHAVMQLNKEDGGNRKWILCNLDEPTGENSEAKKAGYKTIDEIARERIKRAAKQLDDKSGFKHFWVKEPTAQTIDKITEFDPNENKLLADDMVDEFSSKAAKGEDVILTSWLAADGYKFTDEVKEITLRGFKAHYIDNSLLYIIATGWGKEQTKELLNLVGTHQMNLNTIIVYGYSFTLESMKELEINVKQSLNNQVAIEKRY